MARQSDIFNYKSIYEENGVLKNKLGITDLEELEKAERMLTTYKLAKLYLNQDVKKFDVDYLLNIHHFLFCDIYDFAGKIRDENIQKPVPFKKEVMVPFVPVSYIFNSLKDTLEKAKIRENNITNEEEYITHIATLLSDLDIIHPFREGNGRTEREFIRQYVLYLNSKIDFAEYVIDYSIIEDKDEYIKAIIIADVNLDLTMLKEVIKRMLVNKKEKTK